MSNDQLDTEPEETTSVSPEFKAYLKSYLIDTAANMDRCQELLNLHESLVSGQAESTQTQQADLLRSIVVLSHACMEDCLRTVARYALPEAPREHLDAVPFYVDGRPVSKVSLGFLVEHKELTVRELISQAVDTHFDRSSFSSTSEIVGLLRRIGVNIDGYDFLPALGEMIQRRHEIVHRADVSKSDKTPSSISAGDVKIWLAAVAGLVISVGAALVERDKRHNKAKQAGTR